MTTFGKQDPKRRSVLLAALLGVAATLVFGLAFVSLAPESGAQNFGPTPPRMKPPKSHDGFVVNVPSSIKARKRAETTVSLRYDNLARTRARVLKGQPAAIQVTTGTELTKGPYSGVVSFALASNEPWDSCRVGLPTSYAGSLVLLGVGGQSAVPLLLLSSDSFYLDPGSLRQLSLQTNIKSVRLTFVPLVGQGTGIGIGLVPPMHIDLSVEASSGRISVSF